MIEMLAFAARQAARDAARKAGFGLAAGLCVIAGAGFLLSAAWLALAAAKGAIFASLMVGLGLVGLGLILLAVALARPGRRRGQRLAEDLDDQAVEALRRAAGGGPADMERAMHGLLSQAGLTPPATGSMPAMAAALVFGLTLALQRGRRPRR